MLKRSLAVLAAMLAVASPAWSWGPQGHSLIAQHAIDLLPTQIRPFYEANSRYVVALTMLPDDWRDTHKAEIGPQHYINLEELDKPPFTQAITDRATAEKRFGKESLLKVGVLPWAIEERYHKLVAAFRTNDTSQIVLQSALLAHFVGDSHVPFHVTKDYDGRTAAQKGIHFRWEENLIALRLKPESVKPIKPEQVTDILRSAFEWCLGSYKQIDPILKADDNARTLDPKHTYKYFASLYDQTQPILTNQLSTAAEALAGAYAAAWAEAGRPKLEGKVAPLMWEE